MTKVTKKIRNIPIKTTGGTFIVRLEWDSRDRCYLVTVPSLPGAVTFGHTLQEAKKMARELIELHCECLIEEGNIVVDDNKRLANPKGSVVKSFSKVPSRFS